MKEEIHKTSYYLINGITIYRIVAAPCLLLLLWFKQFELFKWLLAFSFFTDLIDGFLARKYKVSSILGTKLDSIGDDLTIVAAIVGLIVIKPLFLKQQIIIISILLILHLTQLIYSLIRYGKISSFHTYLAKTAAILQGVFLILVFFLPDPLLPLFYAAALITGLELIEEVIMVYLLPVWEANVKGLYWVLKRKQRP
jgi:CDP-diacylglycerol--glycerol-3-phosphate 3-phosphatidyltransferase